VFRIALPAVESRESGRIFFSEEKKQKTFVSPPVRRWEAMAGILPPARRKSLLVLFFRKEQSCVFE
jgi:hypothetical protein